MKYVQILLAIVALQVLCGCASRVRYRELQAFYIKPSVPAMYATNAWLNAGYAVANIEGFNAFMARRAKHPADDWVVKGLTSEAISADRDGYLAGVAAAYDAWLAYAKTNAIIMKR